MLLKRVCLGICAISMSFALAQSATSAEWTSDYRRALNAARSAGRPLLVVFEQPSKAEFRISQISAKSDAISASLLKGFELCRIDASTDGGKRIAEAYRATEFPYVAITDRYARRIVYRKAGQFTDRDWATMLVRYGEGVSQPVSISSGGSGSSGRRRCFT